MSSIGRDPPLSDLFVEPVESFVDTLAHERLDGLDVGRDLVDIAELKLPGALLE